jgi:hypothetical protein
MIMAGSDETVNIRTPVRHRALFGGYEDER